MPLIGQQTIECGTESQKERPEMLAGGTSVREALTAVSPEGRPERSEDKAEETSMNLDYLYFYGHPSLSGI